MALPAAADRSARVVLLLSRIALGDQAAFAQFYDVTSAPLYGVALRILGNGPAAEEILQEAYVSVWQHAASYDVARSQPMTWLTSIVRNRCLDQLRRREIDSASLAADDDHDDDDHDGAPVRDPPFDTMTPGEMLLAGADTRSVRDCVEALEAGPRQAIALALFRGLSHAELARQLREPLGTVKSWVRRGLERLEPCLDGAGLTRDP